jgi:peptide/nickel transport system substrate-binding protein
MNPMTRRQLLETATKGGLALGAGGLLASCGSASSSVGSQAGTSTPRHGGTLRAGLTGGSSSDTLDPNTMVNNVDAARVANLYDTLVWTDAEGRPELRLAEEMTPNKDATVWTIRLRKDATFHDGRGVTADDLIFSIHRILNPKSPGQAASMLRGLDSAGIKKLDRYTISVPFSHRYSTFLESQANNAVTIYVLPTDFDPKHPIGTGPFKFVSFTPGQESVFARNESYWEQPLPYVDQLVMTDFGDEVSQVNALLSGQVDAVNLLSQDVMGTVTSSGKQIVISLGGGWNPFTMRVDSPPFNDVRVRQAFRLIVDRPKMMELVFGGHGTLGNDVFSIWSSEYDHGIPQRRQDIPQA